MHTALDKDSFGTRSPVVTVSNLHVDFRTRHGIVRAVNGVSFSVDASENFGLIGESGAGKSTIGRCIVRLTAPTSGTISFFDRDITTLRYRELRPLRARLQMVFQDALSAMNPRMTVLQIIEEPLILQKLLDTRTREERVVELLKLVMLDTMHLTRHPHELSGGQLQRVALARALVTKPDFVVFDEPTASSGCLSSRGGRRAADGPTETAWNFRLVYLARPACDSACYEEGRRHVSRRDRGDRPDGRSL